VGSWHHYGLECTALYPFVIVCQSNIAHCKRNSDQLAAGHGDLGHGRSFIKYKYMYVCMYICIYMYIHIHICIYICIYERQYSHIHVYRNRLTYVTIHR